MAPFDFPASPTVGQVSNGYSYNGYGWAGGPGVSGPVTEQFFDVSGLFNKDVTVPTWAKGVEITASIIPPAAAASATFALRASADGTTFPAGATDYAVTAPYHASLPSAVFATVAYVQRDLMTLSLAGTNAAVPQLIDAYMALERKLTSEMFPARSYARSYDATSGSSTGWFYSWVREPTLGSALRIAALRFIPSANGAWGNGSFIRVKWIGDSAAIPQSNAIADAPNDAYQYLRGQNAWNSGGTLSGDLTVSKAVPALILNKPASGSSSVVYGRNNGLDRWSLVPGSNAAESGSNTGSDFAINRYNDAGTYIDTPLNINRASGVVWANGLAPRPTGTSGAAGEFVSITSAVGAALYLPAGGTWAWFGFVSTASGAVWAGFYSGVSAGGSLISGGSPSTQFCVVIWRIA
jgi:hypothetical protein